MPPKTGSAEVELKVRVPRELYMRVNDYRHAKKLESRKAAVVQLLSYALDNVSQVPPKTEPGATSAD